MRNNLLFAICIISSLFTWTGCSNKLDVIGTWEDLPVIYGLLNPVEDSVTYIRVEKAFLPPDQSANEVAQLPDSIYYNPNDIDVLLFENDVLVDTMKWTDLSAAGIVREDGVFSNSNYAYSTTWNFGGALPYRLEIHNKVTGKITKAYTETLNPSNYLILSPGTSKSLVLASYDILNDRYELGDIQCNWRIPDKSDLEEKVYDLKIHINYKEYEANTSVNGEPVITGTATCKTLTWIPYLKYLKRETGGIIRETLDAENFYQFLKRELSSVIGTNVRRCMVGIDVEVVTGDIELAKYIANRESLDNLVTGLYPPEPYSNIEGGLGVFSNIRSVSKTDYNLSSGSLDYLKDGPFTTDLGFTNAQCQCQ
ncbi:MAG: hypothetical protein MK212_15675 [Saprospiraceae bacterium]|nr:hypothetical protein [Saprospiraceae bacterium]